MVLNKKHQASLPTGDVFSNNYREITDETDLNNWIIEYNSFIFHANSNGVATILLFACSQSEISRLRQYCPCIAQ